jgi:hypothetical protein
VLRERARLSRHHQSVRRRCAQEHRSVPDVVAEIIDGPGASFNHGTRRETQAGQRDWA